jgi:hypothetical protein
MLEKLKTFGVNDPILSWIRSFLTNRTQQVKIIDTLSSSYKVNSGVPQGGHLSPLLFLLFMNDVKSIFRYCKLSLFADDLKLYLVINSLDDCVRLQEEFHRFSN